MCLSPGRSLCPVRERESPPVFARPAVRPAVGLRPLFARCFPSINPPHPPPTAPTPRARFLAVCASVCCPSSSSHPLPSRFRLSVLFPSVARPPPSPLLLLRCHTPYAHCRIVAMRHCRHPGPADDARHAVERVEGRQKAGGGRRGVCVGRAPRRTWASTEPQTALAGGRAERARPALDVSAAESAGWWRASLCAAQTPSGPPVGCGGGARAPL